MLGWTLGGYPSPNLEVVAEIGRDAQVSPKEAMRRVAARRYSEPLAPRVVNAWETFSLAFREFPFSGGVVYNAPMQAGPSNLLWAVPTGYRATMVGLPYDDLAGWSAPYPPATFIQQMEKVASGFEIGLAMLQDALARARESLSYMEVRAFQGELSVAEAAAIHFRSVVNQARFVQARDRVERETRGEGRASGRREMRQLLNDEMLLARRLYTIQQADARIGFEATNHYYYVPDDLLEKIINCHHLLEA